MIDVDFSDPAVRLAVTRTMDIMSRAFASRVREHEETVERLCADVAEIKAALNVMPVVIAKREAAE